MKIDGNNLAFPAFNQHGVVYEDYAGLTKREYFAAAALQGLLANSHESLIDCTHEYIAGSAIKVADQLIDHLNKQ